MSETEEKKYNRSEAAVAAGSVHEALHLLSQCQIDKGDIAEVADDAFNAMQIVIDYFKQE